jgi:alpha-beta hydrolase superfamily lysophospholipase
MIRDMKKSLMLTLSLLASSLTYAQTGNVGCPHPMVCQQIEMQVPYTVLGKLSSTRAQIRAGYYPEQGEVFRGNVIYYQGLGDSMINHQLLFSRLARAGYRVIAFDYLGQGGSSHTMNRTRLENIQLIGNRVWSRYARGQGKKTIIGWSTGGLAAYMQASRGQADQVVLIAPGIVLGNLLKIGEGAFNWPPNEITLSTLTTDDYSRPGSDPHLDPIRPNSPVKVPKFATDLLLTSNKARSTNIPAQVRGLVLLSGEEDSYVNAGKTKSVLERRAPHFSVREYPGALHEIHNEVESIRNRAHADILRFIMAGGRG